MLRISPEEKKKTLGSSSIRHHWFGDDAWLGFNLSGASRHLDVKSSDRENYHSTCQIFGLDVLGVGTLKQGIKADLTLIDLDRKWKVDANRFYSKGRKLPFNGWELHGKAILTMVAGRIVATDGIINLEV